MCACLRVRAHACVLVGPALIGRDELAAETQEAHGGCRQHKEGTSESPRGAEQELGGGIQTGFAKTSEETSAVLQRRA